MEYTKRNWWVEVHDSDTTIEAKSQTICTEVSNCDAQLIAAAPDLYEALKLIREHGLGFANYMIDLAIAKAEKS